MEKLRRWDDRYREEFKRLRKSAVSIPVFTAYCQIRRALRPYNRKNSSFVASFVLKEAGLKEVFKAGADDFLAELAHKSSRSVDNISKIIANEKDAASAMHLIMEPRNRQQIILIFESEALFRKEFEIASDVVRPAPRFFRTHMLAAGRWLHRYEFADDEMMAILAQPADTYVAALRPGRPLSSALKKLMNLELPPSQRMIQPEAETPAEKKTLEGLHGYGAAAQWGRELAKDLEDYRAGMIEWDGIDRGVLLYGPPGCGKTLFASALAATCRVPIIVGSAARWQKAGSMDDMLKAMWADFDKARRVSPSILFVDEIDAFGDRLRASSRNADYTRQVISGFLECLDGFDRREGVVVVGACNYPNLIDPAILRAGRLDRHIEIALPDDDARLAILTQYAGLVLDGDDRRRFVRQSRRMSGADIEQISRVARRTARRQRREIKADDVLEQLPELVKLPKEIMYANAVHEVGHAMVAILLGHGEVKYVKLTPETVASGRPEIAGGARLTIPQYERRTRQHFLNHIAMLLGGIAAEQLMFGEFDHGCALGEGSDLVDATHYAVSVEGVYGMGGSLIVEHHDDPSKALDIPEVRKAVQKLLFQELDRAKHLLAEHRVVLEFLSGGLAEAHFLEGGSIRDALQRNGINVRPSST